MADARSKAKEAVGWLTADRDVEAEGRAEQAADGEASEADVIEANQEVRTAYGETPDGTDDPDRLR